jgi:hypothetical protein
MGLADVIAIGALLLGGLAVVALFKYGNRLLFNDGD